VLNISKYFCSRGFWPAERRS